MDEVLKFLVVFFVVVEPLSVVPVLAGLTAPMDHAYRKHVAGKAVLVSACICLLFAIGGAQLLRLLGISLDAFRIGAGILLFLIALDMAFARASPARGTTANEADEVKHRPDISVFPLAFPLLTGPGALATIMLNFGDLNFSGGEESLLVHLGKVLAMMVVLAVAWVCMRLTSPIMRVLGVTGSNVISRLLGVVLAALAVQYVIDGVKGAMS